MADENSRPREFPKLRIKCTKDIFDALVCDDFGMRLSIASALAAHPEKAVSYGPYNGVGLVDYLIHILKLNTDPNYEPALLKVLAPLDDPRLPGLFRSVMAHSQVHESVMAAAVRISRETGHDIREFLSTMLYRNNSTPQARMAALIMADLDDLSAEERVRIAVVADFPFEAPLLDDTTGVAWLEALSSEAAERATALIEVQGRDAFLTLRGKWDRLGTDLKIWLIEWGARAHQPYVIDLLAAILENERGDLLLAAVRALPALGNAAVLFRDELSRLAHHEDRRVRIAAIRGGAEIEDLEEMLGTEQDVEIRQALISHLPVRDTMLPVLLPLLEDGNWQIRAAATRALTALGQSSIKAVTAFLGHAEPAVRAAAAQILVSLESKKSSRRGGRPCGFSGDTNHIIL